MHNLGFVVGPVLDLSRSKEYDLGNDLVFEWLAHLLQSGNLSSFMVEPPCTTFSPAAYPALRSYTTPLGFDPTEPRTLLGNRLAFRTLALLLVGRRTGAIGLLEQPRRSKMAWLRQWRQLLALPKVYETWTASCAFGSPHQKEFRFLSVNGGFHEVHRKCSRDHTHVRIEGSLTKGSAVYTEGLCRALALTFASHLRRTHHAHEAHRLDVGGLESLLVNEAALALPWRTVASWSWRGRSHINILEAAAVYRLLTHVARKGCKVRLVNLVDSHVALSAIGKGRSPSRGLTPILRRIAAVQLAAGLYPVFPFVPTRLNPGDAPTRDYEVPAPLPPAFPALLGSFPLSCRLGQLGPFKRWAANWIRLVTLLGGYSPAPHPWADFDQTLGFPGEGPSGFSLLLCLLGPFLSVRDPCISNLVPLPFSHGSVFGPVLAQAAGGQSCIWPRNKGDVQRQASRLPSGLPAGRPVEPATQKQRDGLLGSFRDWLTDEGIGYDSLILCPDPDTDGVNAVLIRYGRLLYQAGRPYTHYAETINAVAAARPRLRRAVQQAWDLAFAWRKEEPPQHHSAMPWQILVACIVTAVLWGWPLVAGGLALMWGGVLRIGEFFQASRSHLLLPSDVGNTVDHALLSICEPKTRYKAARHQAAKVDRPQLLQVIALAFQKLAKGSRLWPASPQAFRRRFATILRALQLQVLPEGQRPLDLGSLRAGGATWLLQTSEDSSLVQRRGRWLTQKVMEIYIQEVSATQFIHNLPHNTKQRILQLVGCFQRTLCLAERWDASGIAPSVWFSLFAYSK